MNLMIDSAIASARSIDSPRQSSAPSKPARAKASPSRALAMTAHGLVALRRDLEFLRDERDVEVPQRLRAARVSGETTGSDEYLAIKEDEAVLSARIASLEDLLHRATVVDGATDGHGVIGVGSTVSVEFLASGATACYRIVGAHEPLELGAASAASPIGQALVGQEPGDLVEFELPNGKTQRLRITGTRGPTVTSGLGPRPAATANPTSARPKGHDDGLAA